MHVWRVGGVNGWETRGRVSLYFLVLFVYLIGRQREGWELRGYGCFES